MLVGDDDWLLQPALFRSSMSGSEIVLRDLALHDPRRSLMALGPMFDWRDIERIRVQLALGFSPIGDPGSRTASLVRRRPITPTGFLLSAEALLPGELPDELSGESSLVEVPVANVSSQMSAKEDFLSLVFS